MSYSSITGGLKPCFSFQYSVPILLIIYVTNPDVNILNIRKYPSEGITLKWLFYVEFVELSSHLKSCKLITGFRYWRRNSTCLVPLDPLGEFQDGSQLLNPEQCGFLHLYSGLTQVNIWNASHGHYQLPGFLWHGWFLSMLAQFL